MNVEEAIALIHPPKADAEPLEAKDTPPDEDTEHEEDYDDEDEVRETEEDLSE